MAGEGAVALAADVAAHTRVDLHVLLERTLRLETLPAQQTEDSHVSACGRQEWGDLRQLEHRATLYPLRLEQEPAPGLVPPSSHAQGGKPRGSPRHATLMEHLVCDPVVDKINSLLVGESLKSKV